MLYYKEKNIIFLCHFLDGLFFLCFLVVVVFFFCFFSKRKSEKQLKIVTIAD